MRELSSSDFETGLRVLIRQYGEKAYGQDRRLEIHRSVLCLSKDTWLGICFKLLRSKRYAPLPNEISEVAAPYIQEEMEKRKKLNSDCSSCRGSGVVTYKEIYMNLEKDHAAQCFCPLGNAKASGLPKISRNFLAIKKAAFEKRQREIEEIKKVKKLNKYGMNNVQYEMGA